MAHTWNHFDARFGLDPCATGTQPVFLAAAGWRTGSTLLQRLICSSGEILVWGEPYGRACPVQALTRTAMALRSDAWQGKETAQPDWPSASSVAPVEVPDDLSDHWIANLYPEPQALKQAWRAQLDTLFAAPASARGFQRFGVKEVRWQGLDARFLSWMYPDARFFFLVRNPWDAWASAKGASFFKSWPNERVDDVTSFVRHWRRLTESFLRWPDDSGFLVRYEDLVHPNFELQDIAEHAGLTRVDPAVLETKVRGMGTEPAELDPVEVEQVGRLAGPMAEALGYTGPGGRSRTAA